ncbi:hypothetical protein ABK040_010616 [Willaertia magna]
METTYWKDMNKRNEYLKTYYLDKNIEIPTCPKCHSKDFIIPCSRGKPVAQKLQDSKDNYVKLTGCCRSAEGYCVKCKELIGESN